MRYFKTLLLGCVALLSGVALAHKASDSYLQLNIDAQHVAVRWDIALRDLDAALDIDANEDGKLDWAEVKAAWPRIEAYGLQHLRIDDCTFTPIDRALERRNDGAYAVMFLQSHCVVARRPEIQYTLFRDVDPTHRGIAKIKRVGEALELRILDPTATANADRAARTRGSQAASDGGGWTILREGIRHILTGYDHVLFLLCLLLPSVMGRGSQSVQPVGRFSDAFWPVVGIVSAFTVAHSITLALAAMKVVSLSPAFIEPAIAVTIMLAALDNLSPFFPVPRVVVTFCFGLIHGFGFASVLSELQLPTARFVAALFQFNIGIEIGQLCIVVVVTALLYLLRRWISYRPVVIGGGSAAALLLATLWLVERTSDIVILPR